MSYRQRPHIDIYNVNGTYTWNLIAGCQWIFVYMLAGGAGGTAGTVVAPAAQAGGAGGCGGGYGEFQYPAAILAHTQTVIVGAGGAGGAVSGGAGVSGGTTSFGKYCFVRGGGTGNNNEGMGYPGANSGGAAAQNWPFIGGNTPAAAIGGFCPRGGAGGGGGGGFTSAVATLAAFAGGNVQNIGAAAPATAGNPQTGPFTFLAGGTVTAGAGNPGVSFDGTTTPYGGSGGAGGTSFVAANGSNGGAGGYPGGGGGGGAAAFTGFTQGNGGNGADGFAMVIQYF
jgi:hypothetical protein